MLVLTRKTNERILIGDDIVLTVVRIDDYSVRLGIDAPKDVEILREELLQEEQPA
jgi:carbon storage regulator